MPLLSPFSPQPLLPLSRLPGPAFLSSSLAMPLYSPGRDYMHLSALKTGWYPGADSIFPCSPCPAALTESNRGDFFSGLEPRTHLAPGSFITLLSGGPPHCMGRDSEHKAQAHGKKAINIYIVWLWGAVSSVKLEVPAAKTKSCPSVVGILTPETCNTHPTNPS